MLWRRPIVALYAFVVGLAIHNAVMAGLFAAGIDGFALTAIAAWKELLLLAALGAVFARARGLPFRPRWIDAVALAFGLVAVVYALIPQDALGGDASARGIALALRDYAVLVGAYFLGRSLDFDARIVRLVLAVAAFVAVVGLVEMYAVPIEWWRDAKVPEYFRERFGFDYHGPAGLPENFVFNTGNEDDLLRRLVSTFLSPLGAAYSIVVALCLWLREPRRWWPLAALAFVGLLFTLTRAAFVALAGALVLYAIVTRRWWPAGAAVATLAVSGAFALAYPSIAPETHWFPEDLAYQRDRAKELGVPPGEVISTGDPSIRSHVTSLRDGVETVVQHPQGYGLGNAGATALREGREPKAGESTYAEVGVETGVVGLALFVAWNLTLLVVLLRRRPELGAAFAAVLAIALQTDVLGIPWLVYVVWTLGGSVVRQD